MTRWGKNVSLGSVMEDTPNPRRAIEDIIRISEILAVARAIHSGGNVHAGQEIDYFIEPDARELALAPAAGVQQGKPYRARVEQWHLNEAHRILQHWKR